jgi:sugar phosphate isomerase/epimerase
MYRNLDFESLGISGRQSELIELTLSFGFKGFNLDLTAFAQQVGEHGLDRARRLIDSARLRLGSFALPLDCDADEDGFKAGLAKLPEHAKLASDIGCTRCRATLTPANDVLPYHECFELYRRRFREIGEVLGEHSIRLGIGFQAPAHCRKNRAFQFIHTFDALLLLVKSVTSPHVGVCLDVWHWHVSGGTFEQLDALTVGDVVCVDLSDASTMAGDDNVDDSTRELPSAGSEAGGIIDAPRVLTALAKLGYDGPVTPTAHPDRLDGLRRDEIVKKAGESLDAAWTVAGLSKRGKLVASS